MTLSSDQAANTIGERVRQRKRRWFGRRRHQNNGHEGQQGTEGQESDGNRPPFDERPRSRRRLLIETSDEQQQQRSQEWQKHQPNPDDVIVIQHHLGNYRHHGTGNPLLVRSPRTPKDLAIRTLAAIIQNGSLGELPTSDSTPALKTRVGTNDCSFWTNTVENAGSYGWTGLILPENVDTSHPFPVDQVVWFVVNDQEECKELYNILIKSNQTMKWELCKDKVATVAQLADHLRREHIQQTKIASTE